MPAWLYTLIFLALFGGYWWYSTGRHGSNENIIRHKMKLDEGENLTLHFSGQFNIDFKASDVALALTGTRRVGKPLIIGITDKDRLVLRENGGLTADAPFYITRDHVKGVTLSEERFGKMVGPGGKTEKMATIQFTYKDEEVVKVNAPESGAQAIFDWWKGKSGASYTPLPL